MLFRVLMTVAAIDGIGFGLAALLVPEALISIFGGDLNPLGIWVFRQFGGTIIGFGVVDWYLRNLEPGPVRRGVSLGNLVALGLIALTATLTVTSGMVNALGWLVVAIHSALSIGLVAVLLGREELGRSAD